MTARRSFVALALALLAPIVGCTSRIGPYVWVDQFQPAPAADAYVVAPGDLISVQVWNHPEMATHTRVRDDAKVSIPFLGDVDVGAMTPGDVGLHLERELQNRGLVVSPRVTVALEERSPLKIAVLGEVAHPGLYPLDRGSGLAEALASAGGLTEFAHRDQIFVVRRSVPVARIRFSFDALASARGHAATFRLQQGDVVVVR